MKLSPRSIRLTPPTKYAFYSSIVFAALAFIFYLGGALGLLADGLHFALWIAIVAWVLLAAGCALRGV